jgi:protein-L-isoaspartate O-methyltransferase
MPRYQITDSQTGQTIVVEGATPPSPNDAAELFASKPFAVTKQVQQAQLNRDLAQLKPDAYQQAYLDQVARTGGMGQVLDPSRVGEADFLTAAARNPKDFLAHGVPGIVMAPFTVAGAVVGAAAADAGATIGSLAAGRPDLIGQQGGNLFTLTRPPDSPQYAEELPQQQTLRELSANHPVVATAGKVAQGVVETAPMMAAAFPEGIIGRLVSLGFAADMLHSGSQAATTLGTELGKPPEERDPDKVTSAISDLVQSGAFAPLAGAHGLKPSAKMEVIGHLSTQLLNDPATVLPDRQKPGQVQLAPFEPIESPIVQTVAGGKTIFMPRPFPETPETVQSQAQLAADPNSTRAAVHVTDGETMPSEIPDNLVKVPVPGDQGHVLVNPDKADPEAVAQAAATGEHGQALGFSTPTKPDMLDGKPTVIVETSTPDGVPVQGEVVTPDQVPAAVAAGQAAVPGGTTKLVKPEDFLAEQQGKPAGTPPEAASNPPTAQPSPAPVGAESTSQRPIPTLAEAKAAGMATRGQIAIVQWNVYQKTIDTGRNPNGKRVTPKELADLMARQAALVEHIRQFQSDLKIPAETPATPPPPATAQARAAKLRTLAAGLQNQIDQKRHPAVSNQNLTARRANIAAGMGQDADRLEKIQQSLRALASAHEAGDVLPEAAGITTKAQVEEILRRQYPHPFAHPSVVREYLQRLDGKPGIVQLRRDLSGVASREHGRLYGDREVAAVQKLVAMAEKYKVASSAANIDLAAANRLKAAGIPDEATWNQVKTWLEQRLQGKTTEQLQAEKLAKLEYSLLGTTIPGFFPTPRPVIARMMAAADVRPGMKALEPSAGKGDIAKALKASGAEVQTIEHHHALSEILDAKGFNNIRGDFLAQQPEPTYDRIVMNPPFENGLDMAHVQHAYQFLKPGGKLVSIMSEGSFFRNDAKAVAFRRWLDEQGGTSDKLAAGSFTGKEAFRQTGTATRIVELSKPVPKPELKKEVKLAEEPAKQQRVAFDPKAAKEQKKFLLSEVDKAIEQAPETLDRVSTDADMEAWQGVKAWQAGDNQSTFESRRASVLEALYQKYQTPEMANENLRYDRLGRDIERAKFGQHPKVTIEVPGDGAFDIIHSKQALTDFKERAAKFPTSNPKKEFSTPRSTPTAPAALGKLTVENTLKALRDVVSDDPDRGAIQYVWSDGQQTVATDGRRMTIIKQGVGGTAKQPKTFTVKGKEAKIPEGERGYPNWRQVMPDKFKDRIKDLDTARLFTILRQAQEMTDEGNRSVVLWKNKDGSLGVSSKSEAGSYVHQATSDSKPIAAVHPALLLDLINSARSVGDERVTLKWIDDLAPIALEGENSLSILMPMKGGATKGVADDSVAHVLGKPEPEAPGGANRKGAVGSPPQLSAGGELGTEPPKSDAPPAEDRSFSAFNAMPMEMPEAVRVIKELTGTYPKVREFLGKAAGLFRYTQGEGGKGEVEILARQFDLLTPEEKAALRRQAFDYAKVAAERPEEIKGIAAERYRYLLQQAYEAAKTRNPVMAMKTIWHEIGHVVDWLPDHLIRGRGNLFARIASLKGFTDHVLPYDPTRPAGEKITEEDKKRLQAEAEKQLRAEMGPISETVRKIIVEEPEWKITGITVEDIKNILRESAGKDTPELTRWFAEQSDKVKADIMRKAMRGLVDERLAALGKKEQVGVRRTERIVREKVGREPTRQEILARFKELLTKEIKARNLADLQTVKGELSSLIAWWRGTPTMPDYFKTSWEMYADAFSVWANNPAAAAKRAPTYSELMWNYMDRKPQVKALYDEIQRQIKSGQIMGERVRSLQTMWDADDARSLQHAKESRQTRWRDFYDNVVYHGDRRFGPIYRAAVGTPEGTLRSKVRQTLTGFAPAKTYSRLGALKESIGTFLYRATEHERYLGHLNHEVGKLLVSAGLDWSHDLGEYLYHKRVIEERFNLANPLGFTPKNSLERLAEMERDLGPQRWQALESAAKAYRRLYAEHVVKGVVASRMFTPELNDILTSRANYATFAAVRNVADTGIERILDTQYSASVTPHIYRQIGNLGEIKNPATATVLKGLSLISAVYRNNMKREVVQMLREQDPDNIIPARTRWNGKGIEPIIEDGNKVGTIVYLQDGQTHAFYVRRVVADAVNAGSPTENMLFSSMVRVNGWMKGLFTQLNYAFWPVNMVRDSAGFLFQMPGHPLPTYLKNLPKALAAARQSVTHAKPNVYADEALRRKLIISKSDPRGVWAAADNEYDLKVASFGMDPAQWSAQDGKVNAVVRAWNWYRELGETFERVNKLSGMMYLDEKFPQMPEWQKREIIRERSGSPNFLERGASNPAIDMLFLFYNPWKEGVRSLVKSAKENPFSFTAKATVAMALPTILQAAAVNGWLGTNRQQQYASIPDYDLTNYLCVPLGWQDEKQGKVIYLRLPLWEPARIAHGTLFQTLTKRGAGILSNAGGQLPSLNPIWQVGLAWGEYAMGQNPVDLSRGVNVMPKTTFEAGGMAAAGEVAKYSWNSLGGSIVTRFKNLNLESPPETLGEKFLALPVINNALGRWVKISNRGLADADRTLTAPIEQHRAQLRLAVQQIADKVLRAEALTPSERVVMREPYAQEYLNRILPDLARSRASVDFNRLHNAPDKAAKAAVGQAIR